MNMPSPSTSPPARVGILGGTFDPPHYAHLALAENARAQLALDRVLFAPAGQQPLKSGQSPAHTAHRVEMTRASIADNAAFVLSPIDLERPGPHYTVDTVTLLRKNYPEAILFFLLGGDSLAQLLSWRDPASILEQVKLAAMRRPGYEVDMDELTQTLPNLPERLSWLDAPHLDISATDLRRRVREGLPIRYLLPPDVETYIQKHRLYESANERMSESAST